MSILTEHLVFVNEQIGIQNRLSKKYAKDAQRSQLHTATRDRFIHLLAALTEADVALDVAESPRNQLQTPVLTLRPDELEGLPEELLRELSDGAVPDKADSQILQAIADRGGVATLDQIIVSIYRATGELAKRNTLTSKLYRMAQKGSIFPVPEKKGIYSVRKLSEEEARRLFGVDLQEPQQQSLLADR